MKKNISLLAAQFAILVVMVSCNADETTVDDGAVRFTSGIHATETRVSIDASNESLWDKNDPIGIYMVENGTTTVADGATNVQYQAASSAASTTFSPLGATIYYPVNTPNKVDFIAYHPYSGSVVNYVYPVNLSVQSSQSAIDLMLAKATNSGSGYDKANSMAVNFEFEHQLVKLVLNVSKSAGVNGTLSAVSITGMNTQANFDLRGADGLTGIGTPVAITPYTVTAETKYEAILLPGTLGASNTVTFAVGLETYTWEMSTHIPEMEAGNIYTYDITLTKHAVEATGNIGKWTIGSTGTGIAE